MDTDIKFTADGEYTMPSAEAVLAGTLALMTGHAQNNCPNRRMLMALKIRQNLDQLRSHSGLNAQFRAVLQRLCHEWGVVAAGMPAADGRSDRSGTGPTVAHCFPMPARVQ